MDLSGEKREDTSTVLLGSSYGLAIVALVLLTPFAINNFVKGRLLLGAGSTLIIAVFAVHGWTIARHDRYYPALTLLGLAPAIVAFLVVSIRSQGVIGVLWCYPATLFFYFMLPEKMAWLANVALLAVTVPAAWGVLEAPVVGRMAATLAMVGLASAVIVRVINGTLARRLVQLQDSEKRALAASQAKSLFLANMSHELRTPLNGVLGFAQLLARRRREDSEVQEAMSVVLHSGEQLRRLIDDVLSLSKVEAGRVRLEEGPFAVAPLVREVAASYHSQAETAGLRLLCEVDDSVEARTVLGDAGRLRQILTNLLGNAVKFTLHGSVTLRAAWHAGRGRFDVEDTGPGISEEELEHVFEPFLQTETGRRSGEGTGLGLALSRDLARLMGGDVTVESRPGEGTRFHVEVSLPETDAATGLLSHRGVVVIAPGQPRPRLLVVDDTAHNRRALARLLATVGFEVAEAADGEEALGAWRRQRPDLIWVDKRMPGMDGLELTRRIRAEEPTAGRRVPIIAISASALEHERAEILAAGCDDFVAKPFREAVVFEKLVQHLGIRFLYETECAAEARTAATDRDGEVLAGRVLLVDDDWISREVAREQLRSAGFEVVAAGSGEEAIELFASVPFDLVIMDLHMPGIDGIETLRRIRGHAASETVPVVAMSAARPDEAGTELAAAGFDDHLTKPVEPESLRRVLGRLSTPRPESGPA